MSSSVTYGDTSPKGGQKIYKLSPPPSTSSPPLPARDREYSTPVQHICHHSSGRGGLPNMGLWGEKKKAPCNAGGLGNGKAGKK